MDARAFAAPKGLRPRRRVKPAHDGPPYALRQELDCFAEPVIGRRYAPARWLAMTAFPPYALSRTPRNSFAALSSTNNEPSATPK
jgi:hypothetical protein